jgi:hypothetical protein
MTNTTPDDDSHRTDTTPASDSRPDRTDSPPPRVERAIARLQELRAERDDPEGILEPADLSLPADRTRELDGHRLVVSVDGDGTASARPLRSGADEDRAGRLAAVPEQFAVDLAVKTDHGVATHEIRTDDVGEAFGELLRWCAARIAPGEDPREVVEVLVASGALDG